MVHVYSIRVGKSLVSVSIDAVKQDALILVSTQKSMRLLGPLKYQDALNTTAYWLQGSIKMEAMEFLNLVRSAMILSEKLV